jgi:hypothetical protein
MIQSGISPERWISFTKGQQILMIGSEFERINSRLKNHDTENINPCYERIFDLVDITLLDPKWNYNFKELLRFREVIGELYLQKEKDLELNSSVYKALLTMSPEAYNAYY